MPGEPWSTIGYQRRIPARYLSAAMPHVSSEVGTPTGPYIGYGTGSARRAMRLDLHYGMEKLQQPGFFTITAEPGSGKSVLTGALAFNAARRGEPTIILDPSGPLARLADMPELQGSSRVLDLTASEPGTLSPYQLVPEPAPADYLSQLTVPSERPGLPAGSATRRCGTSAADVRRAEDVATDRLAEGARNRCESADRHPEHPQTSR